MRSSIRCDDINAFQLIGNMQQGKALVMYTVFDYVFILNVQKFRKSFDKIKAERAKQVKKAQKEEAKRLDHTLQRLSSSRRQELQDREEANLPTDDEEDDDVRALRGVWDLHGERPPPSSIAARKDTVCRSQFSLCSYVHIDCQYKVEALRLAQIITVQRTDVSHTHPLRLWTDLNNIDFLRQIKHRSSKQDSVDNVEVSV